MYPGTILNSESFFLIQHFHSSLTQAGQPERDKDLLYRPKCFPLQSFETKENEDYTNRIGASLFFSSPEDISPYRPNVFLHALVGRNEGESKESEMLKHTCQEKCFYLVQIWMTQGTKHRLWCMNWNMRVCPAAVWRKNELDSDT